MTTISIRFTDGSKEIIDNVYDYKTEFGWLKLTIGDRWNQTERGIPSSSIEGYRVSNKRY